ncbi:MAG: hypothetical protein R6V83_07320 [Candidatus Thorarchaeota archaeon]
MRLVAEAEGVPLYAPESAYLSFCNSPYVGHRRASAVDVYPHHSTWNGPCYSPCAGRVTQVRRLKMGKPKEFPTADDDYAIGLQPYGFEDLRVRILHCDPRVDLGDDVERGDFLGELLRSRFFNYWTGPHYHVEIVQKAYFNRSRMSSLLKLDLPSIEYEATDCGNELSCEIQKVTSDVVVCICHDSPEAHAGELFGHLALTTEGQALGILDGGIPHYTQGCVIGGQPEKSSIQSGSSVMAWNEMIGNGIRVSSSRFQYETNDSLYVSLDNIPLRGLSCYVFTARQKIKGHVPLVCIPERYNSLSGRFRQGDMVTMRIEDAGNATKDR